ncbi:hypothetical protein FRC06_002770 [Ceratobasidium sp. 370]|nr:hypothetical protein FRC06_002770 [Ceratobasidium sp. 370]
MAACFADTVRTGQDPTFVQTMTDPYASVAIDWFSDAQNSFAVITPEMYGEGIDPILSFGRSTLGTGGPGMAGSFGALEAEVAVLLFSDLQAEMSDLDESTGDESAQ